MSLQDNPDEDYTPEQLLRMDEEEAEMWLSEEEQERRSKLQDLYEGAEKQREEWQDQEQETVETLIEADMGELTTGLEIYGNNIEILLNLDREQRQLIDSIQTKYGEAEDIEELSEPEIRRLESMLAEFFEVVIREFNDTAVESLSESERADLMQSVVRKWGVRASIYAMIEIIETINKQDQQKVQKVKNLQGGEGPT